MPRSITHYLFAKDCLNNLDNTEIKNIINRNLDLYLLGSQGPNFFNYCNHFPFIANRNTAIISNLIHSQNINLFFKNMIAYATDISCIKHVFNNPNFYEITMSYLYGFLTHYILDKNLHPYIYSFQFHLQSQYKMKRRKSLHKSIETHIDTLLLNKLKNLNPYELNEHTDINISKDELIIICDMYQFLVKSTFNKSILYNDVSKSIHMFNKTEKRLNSSSSISSKIYLYTKNLTSKTSYIDSKIYANYKYCVNDLLNDSHSIWEDPFSHIKYSSSLLDIYYDSIDSYLDLLEILTLYLSNKATMLDVLFLINNKSFLTNQNCNLNYNTKLQ